MALCGPIIGAHPTENYRATRAKEVLRNVRQLLIRKTVRVRTALQSAASNGAEATSYAWVWRA